MIRKLVFFFVLLPSFSMAQNVTVRSGEHGSFTRLVLALPVEASWKKVKNSSANELEIIFQDQNFTYDTSTTFDRIGKNRISDVVKKEGGVGLTVSLACECHAQVFNLNANLLVIDVSETSKLPKIGSGTDDDISELKSIQEDNRGTKELFDVRLGNNPGVGPIPLINYKGIFYPLVTQSLSKNFSPIRVDDLKADSPKEKNSIISKKINVAVDKGWLEPSRVSNGRGRELVDEKPNLINSKPIQRQELPEIRSSSTAFVRTTLDFPDSQFLDLSDHCHPRSSWALNEWVTSSLDVSGIVAKKRALIFQEFDKISNHALDEYVKVLLFYGFGAEARSALDVFSDSTDPSLIALSYILDGEVDPAGYFSKLASCGDLMEVWTLLSASEDSGVQNIDRNKISRGFEVLPKHLQEHLGRSIAVKLSEGGHHSTAKDILARVQRIMGYETNSIRLGKGIVALNAGDISAARNQFDPASGDSTQDKAKSVLGSIESEYLTKGDVADHLIDISRIFSIELRNDPIGGEIWEAHIRSLLINGKFEDAFQEIEKAEFNGTHEVLEEKITLARENAFQFLVDSAPDTVFLKIILKNSEEGVFPRSSEVALLAAIRMLDLGLSEKSIHYINAQPDIQTKPEAIVTKARASLSLYRPEEAERLLIGVQGKEALLLRAEARRQMGDYVLATALFKEGGKPELAERSAWLSGSWNDVVYSDSKFEPMARMKTKLESIENKEMMTLEVVEEVWNNSKKSRDIIGDLLDATSFEN